MSYTSRGSLWIRLGLIALFAVVVTLPGMAQAKDKRELMVMTQNLYLGSNLAPAFIATTPGDFLIGVATIYGTVQATNFPARAIAIADEIVANDPDIIGLQEVSKWTSTRSELYPSQDFLEILMKELTDRGLSYSVASVSNNAKIGPIPLVALYGCEEVYQCWITFEDRDVILVNNETPNLQVFNPQSGRYATQEALVTPVGLITFDRGWVSIDGTFEGKKFHFVNTHLEEETYPITQEAQAREFLAGPAKTGGAVIAVGDFNSAADGSKTKTYALLTKSYFDDAWKTNLGDPRGYTCCQNDTLSNVKSLLSERIDLVLTHAASRALDADKVGEAPFQSAPPNWSSDHAGVVSTIRIH